MQDFARLTACLLAVVPAVAQASPLSCRVGDINITDSSYCFVENERGEYALAFIPFQSWYQPRFSNQLGFGGTLVAEGRSVHSLVEVKALAAIDTVYSTT